MKRLLLVVCLVFSMVLAARAQERPSLLEGVPGDVHFTVLGKASATPDPAAVHLTRAWKLLAESGVHKDIVELALANTPAGSRRIVQEKIDQVLGLLGKVDWALLAQQESVFGFRMGVPLPEYLFIFRVPKDRMESQIAGMKALFAGIAEMVGPMVKVQDVQRPSGLVTVLTIQGAPVQLTFGAVNDALVVSTSNLLAVSSMTRLSGGGEGSLAKSERLQTALKALPPPTEALIYLDIDGLMTFMLQAMQLAGMSMQGRENDMGGAIVQIASAVLRELNQFDQTVVTTASDGKTTTETGLVQALPTLAGSKLAKVFEGQKAWDGWARRVPADATSFSFDSGFDPAALYDLVESCAKEAQPASDPLLQMWDQKQTEMGFKLRDVLAAVSGETASIEFPTVGADGSSMGEMVWIARLEKSDIVSEHLRHGIDALVARVRSRGQKIDVESTGGLYRIRIAALPWINPIVGVKGSDLVFATSPAALEKLDRVAAGKEPDIRSNQRFTALGVGKSDSVRHLTYRKVDVGIAPLADLMSTAGFFLAVFAESEESKAMRVGAILSKVGPALRELDVRYDWASEMVPGSTPDCVITRAVTRYR